MMMICILCTIKKEKVSEWEAIVSYYKTVRAHTHPQEYKNFKTFLLFVSSKPTSRLVVQERLFTTVELQQTATRQSSQPPAFVPLSVSRCMHCKVGTQAAAVPEPHKIQLVLFLRIST
jgi:hypothetical protein